MRGLKGKVAIVTGASSPRGMGRAAALRLAREGVDVVVTDITPDEAARAALDKVVSEIAALGVRAMGLSVDVTRDDQIVDCVARVQEEMGGIDILFNNAGVGVVKPCEELPLESVDLMLNVNTRGVIVFTQAVIGPMKARGGGVIINNSSTAGLYGQANYSVYNASKFGVIGFTKGVALELAPYNIRVNAICPGAIKTDLGYKALKDLSEKTGTAVDELEQVAVSEVALKRWGMPEEVADCVAWLASDESSYVVGVAIPVAGGNPPALA